MRAIKFKKKDWINQVVASKESICGRTYLVLMSLKGTDRVSLVLRHPLCEYCGHDEDDSDSDSVPCVWIQINDLNVVVVAIPKATKKTVNKCSFLLKKAFIRKSK